MRQILILWVRWKCLANWHLRIDWLYHLRLCLRWTSCWNELAFCKISKKRTSKWRYQVNFVSKIFVITSIFWMSFEGRPCTSEFFHSFVSFCPWISHGARDFQGWNYWGLDLQSATQEYVRELCMDLSTRTMAPSISIHNDRLDFRQNLCWISKEKHLKLMFPKKVDSFLLTWLMWR